MIFNKDMKVIDVLEIADTEGCLDAVSAVFSEIGMHCLGCIFAHGESVAEAAAVHNIPVQDLLDKLKDAFTGRASLEEGTN